MDRRTRLVDTVRDRETELVVGAVALGGLGGLGLLARRHTGETTDRETVVTRTVDALGAAREEARLLADVDHPAVSGSPDDADAAGDPDVVWLPPDDLGVLATVAVEFGAETLERLRAVRTSDYATLLIVPDGRRTAAATYLREEAPVLGRDVVVTTPTAVERLL